MKHRDLGPQLTLRLQPEPKHRRVVTWCLACQGRPVWVEGSAGLLGGLCLSCYYDL